MKNSFCGALCLQHQGTISANIESFQKPGLLCSVDLISWWKCSPCSSLNSQSFPGKKSKSERKNKLQVTYNFPFPYMHSEESRHHHWNHQISIYPRSLNTPTLSFPKPLRSKSIRLLRISRIRGPTMMPSVSSAVLILGNLLLRYWNPFEFVLTILLLST